MEIPQVSYRNLLEIPSVSHGNSVDIPSILYKFPMEIVWTFNTNPIDFLWESYGNLIGTVKDTHLEKIKNQNLSNTLFIFMLVPNIDFFIGEIAL